MNKVKPAKSDAADFVEPPFGTEEWREYFRTGYVERDAKARFLWITNGNFYVALVFSVVITVIALCASQITEFKPYFLILLPLYFMLCNYVEYLLHRYPMHHKMKGFEFLYEHVTVHHSFYNENLYYYDHPRDYMAVILPILYFSVISFVWFLGALLIYFLSDLNNAWFFAVVGYSYYFMYEVMHFSYHARENSLIKKLPYVKQLSNLHLQHHKAPLMAHYNFNITFPIFDKILGTVYKEKTN